MARFRGNDALVSKRSENSGMGTVLRAYPIGRCIEDSLHILAGNPDHQKVETPGGSTTYQPVGKELWSLCYYHITRTL